MVIYAYLLRVYLFFLLPLLFVEPQKTIQEIARDLTGSVLSVKVLILITSSILELFLIQSTNIPLSL